jgi:hypothetical protein
MHIYHGAAAESMHALPDIEVSIVEYSEVEHNLKNGIDRGTAVKTDDNDNAYNEGPTVVTGNKKRKSVDTTGKEKDQMYYSVCCKDNGCGIPEAAIGMYIIYMHTYIRIYIMYIYVYR